MFMASLEKWYADRKGLVFLLALSLSIKGLIVLSADVVNVDGVVYISAAQEFADGNFREGLGIFPMPFYPLLIAAFHVVIPDWLLAGQMISLLALVLAVIPLYLLTERVFDGRAAFWAGTAFCLSPMVNGYSADIFRDPIFLFFFAWSVYFAVRALTEMKSVYFVWTSAMFMFAFLCRVEAVVLPVVFLAIIAGVAVRKRDCRHQILKGAGLSLLIPVILIGFLWWSMGPDLLLYNRINELLARIRDVFSIDRYLLIYCQLHEMEKTIPGWGELGHNFAEITRHYLWLVYLIGSLDVTARLLFAPFIIPFFWGIYSIRPVDREKLFLLFLLGLHFFLCYYFHAKMNFMEKRYLLPVVYLMYPFAGSGFILLFQWCHRRRFRNSWIVLSSILFLCIPFYYTLDQIEAKDDTVKVAGEWLASQKEFSAVGMMFSGKRTSFYAERGLYSFSDNLAHMEEAANRTDAELLIIETTRKARQRIPEFQDFVLLKEFNGKRDNVLIYRRNHHESS
jgi:4-amino-4-deoxy-L-arabinose transferase-like glycosyltransferase